MTIPLPPLPSPRPPRPSDDEPKTDPHLHAAFRRHDNKLTRRAVIIAVAAVTPTLATGLLFVDSRASAQAAQQVEKVADQAASTQRELERFQGETARRLERVEASEARSDAKLDAVLSAMRVHNPAPAPKDGGP